MNQKVLFIGHCGGRTGAPMVLLHFLRWVKKNCDLSFEVILRDGGPLEAEYAKLAPVQILSHLYSKKIGLAKRIQRRLDLWTEKDPIESFCNGKQWDLVYSNTITNGKIAACVAASGCPVITHVHEMDYWIEHSGLENLELVKKHTTHFIAASQATKENLVTKHGILESRVSVVHEFIPLLEPPNRSELAVRIRQELGIPENAFVIGSSGAEFWRKGRDLVVHLLMALIRRGLGREIHFVWVGHEGGQVEKADLWHDLRKAGVASHYHATGEVSNPLDYFGQLDVFVLLSREDPFPLVCLEAALLGKPILCFAGAGGIPELVEEDGGFVVPYLDIEAMADKVLFLSHNKDECIRLGVHGAGKVKNNFAVGVQAPKILQIIEKILGK